MPARPPLRVLLDGRGRVPADGPLFDPALGAHARRHDRSRAPRARSTRGGPPAPRSRSSRPARRASASTSTPRSRCSVAKACSRRSSKAAATLLGAVVDGRYAQRLVAYVAPLLLGTDGTARLRVRRAAIASPRRARWDLVDVARVGADVRLELEPRRGRADVHRHRRGARPRACGRRQRGRRAHRDRRARPCSTTPTIGASIAVNGCCLTVVELGDGYWAADAVVETLAAHEPRRARARRSGEPRTPGAPRRPARRPPRAGSRRRDGTVRAREPQTDGSELFRFDAPDRGAALRRAQGFDHGRRHQPHRRRRARRRVRGRGDPAHARGHDARRARASASASISKSISSPSTWNDSSFPIGAHHDRSKPSSARSTRSSAASSSSSSTTRTARTKAISSSPPRR